MTSYTKGKHCINYIHEISSILKIIQHEIFDRITKVIANVDYLNERPQPNQQQYEKLSDFVTIYRQHKLIQKNQIFHKSVCSKLLAPK